MGATTPLSCDIGDDYLYQTQNQLPSLTVQLASNSHPYTVTPPESLASGVRDFGHEDVGRLADVLEEEGERLHLNADLAEKDEVDIKDIILLNDTSPDATTETVQMVNVCPNKITLCGNGVRETSRSPSISSQMYLKDAMKEIFVNISSNCNVPELIVLHGANGAVAVHKPIIAAFSKLVKEQLTEYPECNTIYLPNYSQKIIRKVVEILYTGETFYSEEERKDVNLIWDAMRHLQISFDDKSFYYHPVEYTAVKEEEEQEENSQQQRKSLELVDQSGVDQTDEHWHEDQSSNKKNQSAISYCRVVRQPHPENPTKSVVVQSQYGEGRKIQRSKPALAHVNADEIREKEKIENRREVELLLSKHKPIVIDLSDNDDDENPTSNKKTKTQTYAAGTPVLRDDDFKQLVASGKVSFTMLKAATGAKASATHPQGESCNSPTRTRPSLTTPRKEQTGVSVTPIDPLAMIPAVTIPPNRPAGTGITFIQKSPVSVNDSRTHYEMPKLQPVLQGPSNRVLRLRQKSGDITDLPKLDRNDTNCNENLGACVVSKVATDLLSISECNAGVSTRAAAVVPGSKVNHFVRNQHTQFPNHNMNSELTSVTNESEVGMEGERKFRKRKQTSLQYAFDDDEELKRLREAYYQFQEESDDSPQPFIVVGSKKKAVPDDVNVDAYVENMGEEIDNCDDDELADNEMDAPTPSTSRFIIGRDESSAVVPHENGSETRTSRGNQNNRGNKGSRGRGGGRRGCGIPAAVTVRNNNEPAAVQNQTETKRRRTKRGGRRS